MVAWTAAHKLLPFFLGSVALFLASARVCHAQSPVSRGRIFLSNSRRLTPAGSSPSTSSSSSASSPSWRELAKSPAIWIFAAIFFLYPGAETAVGGWIGSYVSRLGSRGASIAIPDARIFLDGADRRPGPRHRFSASLFGTQRLARGLWSGSGGHRPDIDFRHDKITIAYSKNERSGPGFVNVPFRSLRGTLVVVDAYIGTIRAKAVIDTGGQVTIANLALRDALAQRNGTPKGKVPHLIQGATKDIQKGELLDDTSAISIGSIQIHDPSVTYGDLYIFKQWKLLNEPAILIGMDSLGLLDTLIIDYRRHELQLRMPNAG